jgi:dTDP-glucose 4,6-dehydratase/UDP-glucose 4-epimerase
MNILIAGSKGFIGSHLLHHFRKENLVHACDIRPDKQDAHFHHIQSISDYEKILSENHFDLFINASGSAGVGFSIDFPEKDYELNTSNVEVMLAAIKKHSPQTKFINFSSAAVYGNPKRLPIREQDELAPLSPYGKHKLETEAILKKYSVESGLKTCSVRVFSAYGPGLHKQLFWDLYLKSRETKHIRLFGTGKESRDFIFIDDLVRAIDCIAQQAKMNGECINVSSGIETSIAAAAQLFLNALGQTFELRFSGEVKAGDPVNWKADISLLRNLGFEPKVLLAEGIRRTAESYCALK